MSTKRAMADLAKKREVTPIPKKATKVASTNVTNLPVFDELNRNLLGPARKSTAAKKPAAKTPAPAPVEKKAAAPKATKVASRVVAKEETGVALKVDGTAHEFKLEQACGHTNQGTYAGVPNAPQCKVCKVNDPDARTFQSRVIRAWVREDGKWVEVAMSTARAGRSVRVAGTNPKSKKLRGEARAQAAIEAMEAHRVAKEAAKKAAAAKK